MESEIRKTTILDSISEYIDSADYNRLAGSTKNEYKRIVTILIDEIGHVSICELNRNRIREYRNRWAKNGYRSATIRIQILINCLKPEIEDGTVSSEIFTGLRRVDRPHELEEKHVIWTDEEFENVRENCVAYQRSGLLRALALARYAGFRRSEICVLPASARIRRVRADNTIEWRLRFRTPKRGVLADRPEDARLTKILEETDVGDFDTLAFNWDFEPWKPRQLSQAFDREVARLAERDLVRPNLTLHGLRHTRGVELAEAGASDATIMAHLDHTDEQAARIYRRQASRAILADRGQELIDAKLVERVRIRQFE